MKSNEIQTPTLKSQMPTLKENGNNDDVDMMTILIAFIKALW